MKRKVVIGALAFVSAVGLGSVAPPAEAAPGGSYYEMACRGHFNVRTWGWVVVEGKKAKNKADGRGSALAPGECAWKDRALNSSEKATISFPVPDSDSMFNRVFAINRATAITTCSASTDCVLVTRVRNVGDGTMEAHFGQVELYWKE